MLRCNVHVVWLDETSAVHVSGQHHISYVWVVLDSASYLGWFGLCGVYGGTSSNVVISRIKVLIQLESLILAQSERWRQA